MRDGHRRALAVLAAACLALACGGSDGDTGTTDTTTATTTEAALRVAVVGDSIPFNAPEDCAGCDGFVSQFRDAVADATGRSVAVDNFSRHDDAGVADIASQLETHQQLTLAVSEADIVIVSVGFFDMPPFPAGGPCGGRGPAVPVADAVADVALYTADCITQTVEGQQAGLTTIYDTIAELRSDRPTLLLALDVYSNVAGNPATASAAPDLLPAYEANQLLAHDTWNEAQCAAADAAGFECIDVHHAFNGADGRSPAGALLAPDYLHPSQEGNDVIAALLADVALSPLGD
jgi:lysophospholipase L1-like esterase